MANKKPMTPSEMVTCFIRDPQRYHCLYSVSKKLKSNPSQRFRFWQGVLSTKYPLQVEFIDTLKDGSIFSDWAIIKHDRDATSDGEKVTCHYHFYARSNNDMSYSNMLKKTGLDCIAIMPSEKQNMKGWIDYVTRTEIEEECTDEQEPL